MKKLPVILMFILLGFVGCTPEPPLHLYDEAAVDFDMPVIDLSLEVYWDYEMTYDVKYEWEAEWYYGWDEIDTDIFGELGYTEPSVFNLRRYFTGETPYAPHTSVQNDVIYGTNFQGRYNWGFWDMLIWNDVKTLDGVQSLVFDETSSLDYVTAYTNQTMQQSRYQAPRYTRSFYSPEPLFTGYTQGVEIDPTLKDFEYDPERKVYVRRLNMVLEPVTYIYLTQVILHHNNGRVTSTDGSSNLSGMARSVVLNTGVAGSDAITVYYNTRMKKDCKKDGEFVDIIGGRLMTFGICNLNANRVSRGVDIKDGKRHYMDCTMQFNNGMDSTFVFDVTDQVRKLYKGGVITVELDMDTVPIPQRSGGSGFNAVVKDTEDGGTYEFDM
jgi:hypothetical protein